MDRRRCGPWHGRRDPRTTACAASDRGHTGGARRPRARLRKSDFPSALAVHRTTGRGVVSRALRGAPIMTRRLSPALFYLVVGLVLIVAAIGGVMVGSTALPWQTVVRVVAAKVMPAAWIDPSLVSNADV